MFNKVNIINLLNEHGISIVVKANGHFIPNQFYCYDSLSQYIVENIEDFSPTDEKGFSKNRDWKFIRQKELELVGPYSQEDFIYCSRQIVNWYYLFEQFKNPDKGKNPWSFPLSLIETGLLLSYPRTHGNSRWNIILK